MGEFIKLILVVALGYWVYQAFISDTDSDGLLKYSEYEDRTVDVWFYFPDGREYIIGTVEGASACGGRAWAYASEKGGGRTDYDWSYICCTVEDGSRCKHKIR